MLIVFVIGHDKNPLLSDSWWAGGSFQKVSCGCITEFSVDTKKKKKKGVSKNLVMNPPAMRETWVQFLGWEDPLEKRKATHSSILAWRIPWTV